VNEAGEVEYAKRCFPELTEKMLRDNYAEIAFAYDNNQVQYVNWQGMTNVKGGITY